MPPITWRNVEAPSFRDAILAGAQAQQSFNSGFDSLNKLVDQESKTNIANWDNTAKNNTEKFYADVASQFKTPEEYQAALKSGLVDQMRQQYGAQIDQAGARKYLEERPTVLMDRLTKEQAYTDAQTERGQREYINGFKQAIAAASTPEELATLRQGLNTYSNLGHINSVAAANLVDQAVNRGRTLVSDQQTTDTVKSNIQHQRETERVARINAGTSQLQAQNAALNYAAQLTQNVTQQQGNVITGVNKQLADLDEKKTKLDKASVYSGDRYEDKHAPDLVKVGKDMGISTDAVGSFVKRVKEDYPNGIIQLPNGAKVPITKGLLESAIVQGADTWGFGIDSFKGNRLYNTLVDMINHKDFGVGYQNFVNEQNLIEAQKLAIKEQGQRQVDRFRDSAQPYVEAFTGKLASRARKPKDGTTSNPFK